MPPSWFNLQAYAFDKPVQYKKLLVYPVKMENYYEFNILATSLLLEKNRVVEGITKTYFEYLYFLQKQNKEDTNLLKFDALLKLCLKREDSEITYTFENNKPVFVLDGEKYTSKDFDELRLLICEQNDVELPDESISAAVRDSIAEALRFKMKQNGTIMPTLEDLVVCVIASTALKSDDISNLSIRKFGQLVRRVDGKLHYQIYMTAAMSGFVEFKDKSVLKHWMAGIEEDKWKGTMIDVESMKGKLAFDDKKK